MINFCEKLPGSVWLTNLELLLEVSSDVQNIKYYRSKEFGRILVINDEVQHAEVWAPFYHEIIVHLPCQFLSSAGRALIMGGGSLFAAEELLKYEGVSRIDLVDHDKNVIDATLEVYPERKHIIMDKRLNIIIDKCEKYIFECSDKYDLIINDCFSLSESDLFLNYDIYSRIDDILLENGLVSDLVYRNIYDSELMEKSIRKIPQHSRKAASLLAVPEYPGVFHLLTMWGKNRNIDQNSKINHNLEQDELMGRGGFKIYSPDMVDFYLYLPPYLKKFLR